MFFFFFQAEDGIRDVAVTGVQTCALPISDDEIVEKIRKNGISGDQGVIARVKQAGGSEAVLAAMSTAKFVEPGAYIRVARSEERRVGKECRSRWSPYH